MKTFLNKALCATLLTVATIVPTQSNTMDQIPNIDSTAVTNAVTNVVTNVDTTAADLTTAAMNLIFARTIAKKTLFLLGCGYCFWTFAPSCITDFISEPIKSFYDSIKQSAFNTLINIQNSVEDAVKITPKPLQQKSGTTKNQIPTEIDIDWKLIDKSKIGTFIFRKIRNMALVGGMFYLASKL